jgi:hypothetical protein
MMADLSIPVLYERWRLSGPPAAPCGGSRQTTVRCGR